MVQRIKKKKSVRKYCFLSSKSCTKVGEKSSRFHRSIVVSPTTVASLSLSHHLELPNFSATVAEVSSEFGPGSCAPLKERFRALFTLQDIGGVKAVEQICNCFKDESALLKHELASCLGQMQDFHAVPALSEVLKDVKQEPVVRHEAAEALGAIGDPSVIPVLEKCSTDDVREVSESCKLALRRLQWLKSNNSKSSMNLQKNPFNRVDPAPPADITDVGELRNILLCENVSLFERYQAIFSLRNLRTSESILALAEGLKVDSALMRHEIAFALGQLREEIAIPYLAACLENMEENEMVRHECAEALGIIATSDCFNILNKYINDSQTVVRESCIIALDKCK